MLASDQLCQVELYGLDVDGLRGPSIYDIHKKIRFLTPSPLSTCAHMNRTPCGRSHAVDM